VLKSQEWLVQVDGVGWQLRFNGQHIVCYACGGTWLKVTAGPIAELCLKVDLLLFLCYSTAMTLIGLPVTWVMYTILATETVAIHMDLLLLLSLPLLVTSTSQWWTPWCTWQGICRMESSAMSWWWRHLRCLCSRASRWGAGVLIVLYVYRAVKSTCNVISMNPLPFRLPPVHSVWDCCYQSLSQ